MNRTGIIQRLKEATSSKEIDKLIAELSTYEDASPATIRRAHKAADQRRAEVTR